MLVRLLIAGFLVALVGCGEADDVAPDAGIPDAEVPEPTPIVVDVDWVRDNLSDPDLQIVDARVRSDYEESRIPGAISVRPEQLAEADGAVPSQIAPAEVAEAALGAAGLRNDSRIVVYGAPPEFDPARVVWALRYYGHGDVRYLDGGYAAWVDSGGDVDASAPMTEPTTYVIEAVDARLRVTSAYVLDELGEPPYATPGIQLVDARSVPEFDAGRVPTARLVQWTDNLANGFLKSVEEIEALHEGLDPRTTTVTYCLIGWRGSVAWLALEYIGYDDVRLYDGSWAEWGNGNFPVEP
ncbi:MAG: rhodanese-like domain-containing protein [Polyangiales bacterium]